MNKSFDKIICLLIIVSLNWAGVSVVGETFAYFSDKETASQNSCNIAILDFSVFSGQNNFTSPAEEMEPGDSTARDIYINQEVNSLPLKHDASYEFVSGDSLLCDQLNLKIWYNHYNGFPSGGYTNRDMRLKYNGSLVSLNNLRDSDFEIPHLDDQFDTNSNDGTKQWFFYKISLADNLTEDYQGKVCHFKFNFKGWQNDFENYGEGGFTDIEEIENTIKTGYWDPPVVLNEFLPNAGNYPEFIELYNKSNSSIDLQGYKIKTDRKEIIINSSTTEQFSGTTLIPSQGWLVVSAPSFSGWNNILNDNAGTVSLYDKNDIKMDSYSYGNSDYNVNNNPGSTNNLALFWPLDGTLDDLSGNNHQGVNHGVGWIVGKINEALNFDGFDDYANTTSSNIFNSEEFAAEAWIKTNSTTREWVMTKYKEYGPGWGLGIQNGHVLGYIRTVQSDNGKVEIEGSTNIADNNWHHLVLVREDDSIKLYVDGVFEKQGSLAGNTINDEVIEIGRISYNNGSGYLSGRIDEVKIFDRPLDSNEISEHFNDATSSGSVPLDKSFARIPDGLGAWVDPIPTPGIANKIEDNLNNVPLSNQENKEANNGNDQGDSSGKSSTTTNSTTSENIISNSTTTEDVPSATTTIATTTEETSPVVTSTEEVSTTTNSTTTEENLSDSTTTEETSTSTDLTTGENASSTQETASSSLNEPGIDSNNSTSSPSESEFSTTTEETNNNSPEFESEENNSSGDNVGEDEEESETNSSEENSEENNISSEEGKEEDDSEESENNEESDGGDSNSQSGENNQTNEENLKDESNENNDE